MHVLFRHNFVLCLLLILLTSSGCGSTEQPLIPTATPIIVVQTIEVPVESTRLVEQQVIVTATPGPPAPCKPDTLTNSEAVTIGALVPLTGRSAVGGMSMQAGINIAVDKINSEGGVAGKLLRLITYDTGSDVNIGAARTTQLITQDCVVGIVGIYDSDVGLIVKDVLHQFNIPGIFVDTYNDDITASKLPEVFRIAPSMAKFAQMAALWMAEVGDYNDDGQIFTVIIAENSPYGQMQTERTITWLDESGISHNEQYIDLPTTDFSSVIARIVDMEITPDVILIRIPGENGLELTRQLAQNGIGPQKKTLLSMGQIALEDDKFWQVMGADGVSIIALRIGSWPSTVLENGQQFVERYHQYNKQWPTNAAFGGYDAVHLLVDAIKRSPSLAGNDLINALETTQISLAAGDYSFPFNQQNPPSEESEQYLWHQWLNVPLLYLQYTEPNQNSADMAVIWPDIYRTTEGPLVEP